MLKAMTLIEVLIAVGILAVFLTGILGAYVSTFILANISRDMTIANNVAQEQMERLKKENFDNLTAHNGATFDFNVSEGNPGKGRIEVANVTAYTTSNIKEIRIIASFRSLKTIIGEDKNLNGSLDTGEDTNNNTRLDSPVELNTLITK